VLMDGLAPHYGDDFWFLSYHAMALSEDGQLMVLVDGTAERSRGGNLATPVRSCVLAHAMTATVPKTNRLSSSNAIAEVALYRPVRSVLREAGLYIVRGRCAAAIRSVATAMRSPVFASPCRNPDSCTPCWQSRSRQSRSSAGSDRS
jgi:hypothetical protein